MKLSPYYEHGGITIHHGDCRLFLNPDEQGYDLLVTDPPYGIGESSARNASRGKPFGGKPQGRNTRGTAIPPRDYGVYQWDRKPASPERIALARSAARHQIIFGGNFFDLPPNEGERGGRGDNLGLLRGYEMKHNGTRGRMQSGSPASTEKRGALNPALCRWLMGFPREWDDCAPTATRSSRKSLPRSSEPPSKGRAQTDV